MGRCLFARGRGVATLALSIVSVLSLPSVAGPQDGSLARAGANTAAASTDIEAASTLDLTGLQSQFSQVADKVSGAVVAISASCTPVDGDDALQSDALNAHKLDALLAKT